MKAAWTNISFIDKKTGEVVSINPLATSQLSCDDREPINVQTTYKFECTLKNLILEDVKELIEENAVWKTASRLSDELNDLIEEYHAPGTPRRERRAIKREFDKVFKIFQNYCKKHEIEYSFQRPNK